MTESVTVFDTPSAVDVQPLVESVLVVGPAHDTRGQYSAFRSPVNAKANTQVNTQANVHH
ncbi:MULTISPECIES: hypothetical protein [Symbiopectobacterium]|uniref:hypothetical protein n=1 Tax=Symbiopectobacterium TaxID=801 RepID=UPI001A1D0459|nr:MULTISPECIES: hypothetical protein [Symbiopectobacterium]MBG6247222.1 hypothetical protein [Candidatus Symbiopectobacterium sp. PLON1]MBT9428287.1 hypothetical protein [Candidatus Symbiopectobacterium endolongispinus]